MKALHSYLVAETLKRISCKPTEAADIALSAPEASFIQDGNTLKTVTACQMQNSLNYSFFFSPLLSRFSKAVSETNRKHILPFTEYFENFIIKCIRSASFLHKYFLWKRDLSLCITLY